MKKRIIYLLILITIILIGKFFPSIFYFISFQDFYPSSNYIQIYTSSIYNPFLSLIIHIFLRTSGLVLISHLIKNILLPIKIKNKYMIYIIIFLLYYTSLPCKGYVFVLLSLFPISLFEIAILINIASFPSYLCQIIGHRPYVFNDYSLSILIGLVFLIVIFLPIKVKRL